MDQPDDLRQRMNVDRRRRFGSAGRTLALLCECGDPDCHRTVLLSVEDYDARRPASIVHPEHGQTQEIFGPGVPIVFSRTPANMERPISKLGEHNLDVYRDLLGLSPEEIERLRKEAAI